MGYSIDAGAERPVEDPDDLRREIRENGARVAYEALRSVCLDPKAPAPAKATAGTTILRVGGYLEKSDDPGRDGLEKATAADLERLLVKLRRDVEALEAGKGALFDEGPAQAARAPGRKARAPARKGAKDGGDPPPGLFD